MANYHNKWALITGASAGIGSEFARALAKKGANLVLVARRQERLETLATTLQEKYQIQTVCIKADLADPGAPDHIMTVLQDAGIKIDILINNAGFGLPGTYIDNDWQAQRDFLELMTISYAALTHHLMPGMIERKYGRIIQVASVAGLTPGAKGHTLYGATKAFLINFAQSLAAEGEEHGVYTSALCPGYTYTEFHDVNNTRELVSKLPSFIMMQVAPVVEGALKAVEKPRAVYVPGPHYKFIVWLSRILPRPWTERIMRNSSKRIRRANK